MNTLYVVGCLIFLSLITQFIAVAMIVKACFLDILLGLKPILNLHYGERQIPCTPYIDLL